MLDSLDTLIAFVLIMLVVSMLIMICVQILSAVFNLRGKNLGRGLTHTFKTISPALGDQAQTLACRILSGQLLSDSPMRKFGRCATAVRPDEVFDALHRVATGRAEAAPELRKNARDLLRGLGISEAFLSQAEAQVSAITGSVTNSVKQLAAAADTAVAQLPEAQQGPIKAAIGQMAEKLNAFETSAVATIGQDAAAAAQVMDDAYKKFTYWFEASQDRAQQWFTSHTRWFTVGLAFWFAFWLQLDTVEIFKLVSSNRAVRDKLVAQADVVTKQAEKVLLDRSPLAQALDSWRASLTDETAKQAVKDVAVSGRDTRDEVFEELKKKLGAAGIQDPGPLLASFDTTLTKTVQENVQGLEQDYGSVSRVVDKTGFSLFPPAGKGRWGKTRWENVPPHIMGMLFSAALLSLGAPFWFNALKSLTNLRSRVAQDISTEKDKKAPSAEARQSTAPPTV